MKLARRMIGAAAVLVVLVPGIGRGATPAASVTSAESALVRISTGSSTVSLGTDDASTRAGAAARAFARFVTGSAADQQVGAAERTAEGNQKQASATVGDDELTLADLLSVSAAGASIATSLGPTTTSSVEAQIAEADVLSGLADIVGATMTTHATSAPTSARVVRTIEIGTLRALDLGRFLEVLGVNPLQLSCDAVESLGVAVGRPANGVCADMATADAAIASSLEALADARDDVLAARDSAEGALATMQPVLDDMTVAAASLAASLSPLSSAHAAAVSALEAAQAALDQAQATLAAHQATRTTLLAQRTPLAASLSGRTIEATTADRAAVEGACSGLGSVQRVLCETTTLATDFVTMAASYGVDPLPSTFTSARAALLDAIDSVLGRFSDLAQIDASIASVDGSISTANGQVDAAQAAVASAQNDVTAIAAELDPLQTAIDAQASQIAMLQTIVASLEHELDSLARDLAVMDVPSATQTTCAAVTDTLTHVGGVAPTHADAFSTLGSTLETACDAVAADAAAVLAVPLVTLNGVTITIDVHARAQTPTVAVTGNVGSVAIGASDPVVIALPAGSDEIPAARAVVADGLAAVAEATGIGLEAPQVEILASAADHGSSSNGTWFARAAVSLLRVTVPADALTLPNEPPLGALAGMRGFTQPGSTGAAAGGGALLGAPRALILGAMQVDSPSVAVDVAAFEAESSYRPAGTQSDDDDTDDTDPTDPTDDGSGSSGSSRRVKTLPKTGVGTHAALLAWSMLLTAAVLKRRVLDRRG